MKKLYLVLPIALILCIMVGCQDKEAMAELEAMKAQAEIEEQNKEAVRDWLAQWDSKNFTISDKIIADNFVFHLPGGIDLKGADEFIEAGKPVYAAFPDLKHEIKDSVAEGDTVIIRFGIQGTHKAEFMGIPPTEKQIKWTGIAIYRFLDGKCVEGWVESDSLGQMQQLGMELKPKEGEKYQLLPLSK